MTHAARRGMPLVGGRGAGGARRARAGGSEGAPAGQAAPGNSFSGGNGIKGVIDELAIYPSALSAERVAAHHDVARGLRGAGRR